MKNHMRLFSAFTSVALLCAATLVVSIIGASDASAASTKPIASASAATLNASSCTGPTVKLGQIGPINTPAEDITPLVQSARAAAAAVTKSCELGGPVKIITCNDQYSPNVAAQCGRTLVSDGVSGVIEGESAFGDSYTPILQAAGIPEVGTLASTNTELTSPISFPLVNAIVALAAATGVAKNLGATKMVVVGVDVAAVQTLTQLLGVQAKTAGLQYLAPVLVPPTATNYSQYAAQAVATGANVILPIFPTAQNESFLKALGQQGTNLNQVHVIVNGITTSQQDINQIGSAANGIYLVSTAWPASYTTNPGIKQYNTELKAAGYRSVDKNDLTVIAWSDVHIIANLLKNSKTKTAAALLAKIKTSGPMSPPQLAPFNFSENAFPSNPIFSKMQAFSQFGLVEHVVKGKEVLVTHGFVNLFGTYPISKR